MTDDATAPTSDTSSAIHEGAKPIAPRDVWLVGLLLLVLAFASTALSLIGSRLWGDDTTGPGNRLVLNSTGLSSLWVQPFTEPLVRYPLTEYAPLTQVTYFVERLVARDAVLPGRIFNVVLHAACGWMAWLLLRRLGAPLAWLAAAIFVVHPLQVQNVSWVAQRSILLASLLGMASVYLMLRSCGAIAVPKREGAALPDSPGRLFAMGLLLFVLANFADARAGVLSLLALFLAWWRLGTDLGNLPFRLLVWPPLIGLGFTVLAVKLQVARGIAAWRYADSFAGDFAVRLQLAGLSAWHYFVKALVPIPLRIDDPQWNVSTHTFIGYFAFVAVVVAIAGTWTWRKQGLRVPFLAVSSFVILLLPALCFVNLISQRFHFVADRYAYLAVLPAAAFIAWLVFAFARRGAVVVGSIVVVALLALSIERSRAYASNEAFLGAADAGRVDSYFAANARAEVALKAKDYATLRSSGARMATLASRKDAPVPIRGLLEGSWYVAEADRLEGNLASAIRQFEVLVQLQPDYGEARRSLGLAWLALGDVGKAKFNLERAILLGPRDGNARVAYAEMLVDRIVRGTTDTDERIKLREEARQLFADAIACDPNNADHHMAFSRALTTFSEFGRAAEERNAAANLDGDRADLAVSLAESFRMTEQYDAAEKWANTAIERDPKLPEAYLAKSRIFASQAKPDDAIAALNEGLKQLPDHPLLRLDIAGHHFGKGDYDTAGQIIESLLAKSPNSTELLGRLIEIRGKQGNLAAVGDALQRLVDLRPNDAKAVFELTKLRKAQGRLDDAIALAELFVKLRPDVAEGKQMLSDYRKERGTTQPTTQP